MPSASPWEIPAVPGEASESGREFSDPPQDVCGKPGEFSGESPFFSENSQGFRVISQAFSGIFNVFHVYLQQLAQFDRFSARMGKKILARRE